MSLVDEHEDQLRLTIEKGLAGIPGVVVHSRAKHRTPTLLLTFEDRDLQKAYEFLAGRNTNAPASSFYALEASRWPGLGDKGGLRVGLAPYSNSGDVDRLLRALEEFLAAPRP
jgi:selenocysteine lyase/cysteine desulfurase